MAAALHIASEALQSRCHSLPAAQGRQKHMLAIGHQQLWPQPQQQHRQGFASAAEAVEEPQPDSQEVVMTDAAQQVRVCVLGWVCPRAAS